MDQIPITNEQLAAQFFDVISRTSLNLHLMREEQQKIATCSQPIAETFQKNGSLKNIRVPYLRKSLYPVLEDILRHGDEVASKRAIERDYSSTTQKLWAGIRPL